MPDGHDTDVPYREREEALFPRDVGRQCGGARREAGGEVAQRAALAEAVRSFASCGGPLVGSGLAGGLSAGHSAGDGDGDGDGDAGRVVPARAVPVSCQPSSLLARVAALYEPQPVVKSHPVAAE